VSTDFTSTAQSYTIQLTDLANVWTETLDKRPIIMRALKEDTSIDPTDGPDQIRKLLELLRAAFDPSAPEHSDTSLALTGVTDGEDGLEIHVSVVLPKPLRPLKWPLYLKKSSPPAIATELVLPLIHAHQHRAREVDELVATLNEKDNVIAKLVDKLEATGTGLEHVFNQLSGRRKVTRAIAEDRVKGLAPFREPEFRKRVDDANTEGSSDDVSTLLDSVFGGRLRLPSGTGLEIGDSPALNDWWTKLGRGKHGALVSRGKETKTASRVRNVTPTASEPATPAKSRTQAQKRRRVADDDESTADEADDDDNDDFQVQVTPAKHDKPSRNTKASQAVDANNNEDDEDEVQASAHRHQKPALHARSHHVVPDDEEEDNHDDDEFRVQATPHKNAKPADNTRSAQAAPEDEETASENEDEEIPDSMPSQTIKQQPPKKSGSKLGSIGGKKQASSQKAATPSPPRTRQRSPTPLSENKTSDIASDADHMDTTPPPPPPKQAQTPSSQRTPRGGRLGRIGGRAKESTPEPTASQAQSQATPSRRRLGHIGKKVDDSQQEDDSRGRRSTKDDDKPVKEEKRETSMERADRKRAELRAEMDKKAHQPAKKKRKF
jgi:hypothetical protein